MTQEIIEMARDSGMELYGLGKDRARFVHHLEAFAKLVAERALADNAMCEVQRLGQEIEQEPIAWKLLGSAHFRKTLPKNTDVTKWSPLYSAPQRSWVGLSEKKQWEIARNISCFDWGELMSETEQALKELNQ